MPKLAMAGESHIRRTDGKVSSYVIFGIFWQHFEKDIWQLFFIRIFNENRHLWAIFLKIHLLTRALVNENLGSEIIF